VITTLKMGHTRQTASRSSGGQPPFLSSKKQGSKRKPKQQPWNSREIAAKKRQLAAKLRKEQKESAESRAVAGAVQQAASPSVPYQTRFRAASHHISSSPTERVSQSVPGNDLFLTEEEESQAANLNDVPTPR